MIYRVHIWGNLLTGEEVYGIQGQAAKGERFQHVADEIGGKLRALIYTTRERAAEVVAILQSGLGGHDIADGLVPFGDQTWRGPALKP